MDAWWCLGEGMMPYAAEAVTFPAVMWLGDAGGGPMCSAVQTDDR